MSASGRVTSDQGGTFRFLRRGGHLESRAYVQGGEGARVSGPGGLNPLSSTFVALLTLFF
jgi:hypothetical protein